MLPVNFLSLFLPLFTSLAFCASAEDNELTLKYVQAIWRHGDRAPKRKPYPSDPYDDKYWPRGWNQLTTRGMAQMRELGQFVRERYVSQAGFVSGAFDRKEVQVRSSSADRAVESAQSLLSGLFPPSPSEQFDESLHWQPIPIHTNGPGLGEADPLLRPSSFECPTYSSLKKQATKDLESQLAPEFAGFAEFLRPILQVPADRPVRIGDITQLKNLQMEVFHGLPQPDWVHRVWPEHGNKSTLDIVLRLRNAERIAEFHAKRGMARLSGGYLLGDWLDRMQRVANESGATSQRVRPEKMLLYSAHDGTILALLSALELTQHLQMPPYASCLMLELKERKADGQHFVELYFRRNGELEQLELSGCAKACPLHRFVEIAGGGAILGETALFEACGTPMCRIVDSANSALTIGCSITTIIPLFAFVLSHFAHLWPIRA